MDCWWALANRFAFLSILNARPASTRPCVLLPRTFKSHRASSGECL